MARTRAYRRYVRNKAILRKKSLSIHAFGFDWFLVDGAYSKGHIGCCCKMCKYTKHYNIPLLYEVKDREYVKQYIAEVNNDSKNKR